MNTPSDPTEPVAPLADVHDKPAGASQRPLKKIIVAIHGVGSQRRSDTIRTVAHRFGGLYEPSLPVMSLGYFNVGGADEVHVSQLDVERNHPLWNVGFIEIYWADVPRSVVMQGDTLEESKAWGRTIIGRAQDLYRKEIAQSGCRLTDADFALTAGVIEEIVESIALMENLMWALGKAGILKFNLSSLLTDYVGDVQLVAEFQGYRKQIIERFHDAMTQILCWFAKEHPDDPEIYVIAHSEGTVISFLAMLEALSMPVGSSSKNKNGGTIGYEWIKFVRGFMTIGSPIDKHILLWPKLWAGKQLVSEGYNGLVSNGSVQMSKKPSGGDGIELPSSIKWRNYYDYGDPIGFQLDTARAYLSQQQCGAFEFDVHLHDIGFSRYWFPGKAHNDYWDDTNLFRHFVDDVVLAEQTKPLSKTVAKSPTTRPLVNVVSVALPYALSLLLHVIAVYVMFKAVITIPSSHQHWTVAEIASCVIALALLLAAVTVTGRLPRLVKHSQVRWWVLSAAIFSLGAYVSMQILPVAAANFLAAPFLQWSFVQGHFSATSAQQILVFASATIALSGWLVPRQPRIGRRVMIGLGMLLVAIAMTVGYQAAPPTPPSPPLWPLVLSALIFIYLWWLGIIVFDLTFIWHRYIRNSVALDTLRDWRAKNDALPRTFSLRKPKK